MRSVGFQVPVEGELGLGERRCHSSRWVGTRVLCPQKTVVSKGARSEKFPFKV